MNRVTECRGPVVEKWVDCEGGGRLHVAEEGGVSGPTHTFREVWEHLPGTILCEHREN